jgi:hypothetical protein
MKALTRIVKSMLLTLSMLTNTVSFAQQPQYAPSPCPYPGTPTKSPDCHPYPQPALTKSKVTVSGDTIIIDTGESLFAKPDVDPFTLPPGTNFLPTIYTNMYDLEGKEMLNTLPSTPAIPYNLHDGDPVVTQINEISPTDDLRALFDKVLRLAPTATKNSPENEPINTAIKRAIDILEGNPVPERVYSGLPVLHYLGPDKVKRVTPIFDDTGKNVVGGNVDVHQVWYDSHIESDTAFIDPSAVMNVPWTVTYTVDVLSRGDDDFSPFVMYWNPPPPAPSPTPRSSRSSPPMPGMPIPHIGMDQSFFPMEAGTRTVFKIKMAQGKYFNLTYTWGWRVHPPRAQVFENANKKVSINGGRPMSLPDWERSVFCPPDNQTPTCSPTASKESKRRAINMIGDLAPEKQMWLAMGDALTAAGAGEYARVIERTKDARDSLHDWGERTRLPHKGKHKVDVDPNSDLTVLYVNNTMYAQFSDRSNNIDDAIRVDFTRWKERPTTLKVTLINGDHFAHGYQNVDFGGARGWENQFKSSVKVGGSGCWFTFGRAHWWMNIPNTEPTPNNPAGDLPTVVPAATRNPYKPSVRKVQITFNYEPSRRLRFYQFDPLHHDVAILSIH